MLPWGNGWFVIVSVWFVENNKAFDIKLRDKGGAWKGWLLKKPTSSVCSDEVLGFGLWSNPIM